MRGELESAQTSDGHRVKPRIGVFGGSFDPIHIGHLIIAEILQFELGLERVLFLPAGRPPHKPEQDLAADHHRIAMINRSIDACPAFELSTVDLDRPGSSYTSTTLELIHDSLGAGVELVFLMGQDSLRDFPDWREPNRIAQLARLGVALRPGVSVEVDRIADAVPEIAGRIDLVDVPLIGISSRDVRRRVRSGEPYRFQVPPRVFEYIVEHGLYEEVHRRTGAHERV